jgi:hypothetical protein
MTKPMATVIPMSRRASFSVSPSGVCGGFDSEYLRSALAETDPKAANGIAEKFNNQWSANIQ